VADVTYWTTEQVAEHLGVETQSVYESRRRGLFPGNLGVRRGRRLMFPSDAIEAGAQAVSEGVDPDSGETTNDVNTAILWALQGIKKTLDAMHNEMRRQPVVDKASVVMHPGDYSGIYFGLADDEVHITGNTIDIEEEE
jgi:hypothetical protein